MSKCGFFMLYTEGSPKIDFFQLLSYLINLKSIFAH